MKKRIISLVALSVAIISSCSRGGGEKSAFVLYQDVNMENRLLNFETTKKEGSPHGGKYFSGVDSTMKYGVGYSYVIPDSLKHKQMTIYVTAWVRESEAPLEGTIALSLNNSKECIGWDELKLKKGLIYKPNDWIEIKDSVTYPAEKLNDTYTEIGVFAYKANGKDRLDIDDLVIKYKFSN